MNLLIAFIIFVVIVIAHLAHIQWTMTRVPYEIEDISSNRWTEEEIRETYKKMEEKPVDFVSHLPPKLNRRYVVVGGSGMWIQIFEISSYL
jgi:hypothetical protein